MVDRVEKKYAKVLVPIQIIAFVSSLLFPVTGYTASITSAAVVSADSNSGMSSGTNAGAGMAPITGVGPTETSVISNARQQLTQPVLPENKTENKTENAPAQKTVSENLVPNEFQTFIGQSIGSRLAIFGSELFNANIATFAPLDNIPVTPDYLIGPGDQIVIKGWGTIDIDFTAVVNR